MKNLIIILAVATQFITVAVYGQHSFSNVKFTLSKQNPRISFTLPSEANVTYYRIDAGKDTTNFDIIGTVRSTGNSMLPKTYNYDLYHDGYTYFRVCKIGMDGSIEYSHIVDNKTPELKHQQRSIKATPIFADGKR